MEAKKTSRKDHPPQIRSVAKALMILDLLAASQREMSLAELAREMELPKSTLHGLLSTLRDYGYIEQSAFDGRYRLGIRLFEIGNAVANNWDVRRVAAPYIQHLVEELEETVHLVILDKGEVLYIDKRESRQSLRIVSQVGMRLPAHCTGVGKVLLAYLHPSEVKRIIALKGLPRYTRNTITDPRRLEAELEKIRSQGYAIDNEEIMDGLRCVAAPLREHNGKVCAAISVSGPAARMDGERLQLAIDRITRTAAEISAGLGYRPVVESDASGA
ncbi:IclR family transcriptional regulator [Neomoorella thermoacetica]|uniref:Glycerol operon regulatory protein n=2 Tax=Neomoorella thermoacetica TaxID=1525 RepID=A0A1D7XC95_NEOTH|nr:IclR family transcriptional regulator [Moorella thermoacetica]AKX94586.1 transcriptional regulator KdgR [Moorella thermoacetica]AKX97222.1 transcriptional regulator KdgR [Moorella thermoacetica]AOQ24527.1 Transcriptional regulator KdgR [Moorella thermoacetica]APC08985.1 transcriptional regulator KdgR [Moorella thermoacetica]OIQ11832.1 transcriptional regulator KdgR [Moorella thermoacetica]